jgi:hypothetical protein
MGYDADIRCIVLIRCMEHAIHVAGGHFIRAIRPASSRTVTQKGKESVADRDDDGDDGPDSSTDFDVGDTVGKALALVTQVSSYPIYCQPEQIGFTSADRSGSRPKHVRFSARRASRSTFVR